MKKFIQNYFLWSNITSTFNFYFT